MIPQVTSNNFIYKNYYIYPTKPHRSYISSHYKNSYDSTMFTGMSQASEYKTVFDYLAAKIIAGNKKFNVNSGMISASKIGNAVKKLFNADIYGNYPLTDYNKIKWKYYIPMDIRENSVDKINHARKLRLSQWASMLETPQMLQHDYPELAKKLHNNPSLKFVIWNSVTSELRTDNRHIPVPLDCDALLKTIKRYEDIEPIDRNVTCAKPSFIEYYTHRLRDNLLMDMNLSNNEGIWVKIPSLKHDHLHKLRNIKRLEILSNKNWCTRSSDDKAADALADGDFYIYLKRTKPFNTWEPMVGMTSLNGKIDQIQGKENDNIIPVNLVGKIKEFIKTSGLKCQSGIYDEGPKATQAIMISEKLNEKDIDTGKALYTAIKETDVQTIFKILSHNVTQLDNGNLKIDSYKPSYNLDTAHGYNIPYSMFGIDENELLKDVEIIDGNFILSNKNNLFNSTITYFPKNLKKVTKKVICNREQFAKYQNDILRVVDGDMSRIQISGK